MKTPPRARADRLLSPMPGGAAALLVLIGGCRMVVDEWPRERAIMEKEGTGFNPLNLAIARYVRDVDVTRLRRHLAQRRAEDAPGDNGRAGS